MSSSYRDLCSGRGSQECVEGLFRECGVVDLISSLHPPLRKKSFLVLGTPGGKVKRFRAKRPRRRNVASTALASFSSAVTHRTRNNLAKQNRWIPALVSFRDDAHHEAPLRGIRSWQESGTRGKRNGIALRAASSVFHYLFDSRNIDTNRLSLQGRTAARATDLWYSCHSRRCWCALGHPCFVPYGDRD